VAPVNQQSGPVGVEDFSAALPTGSLQKVTVCPGLPKKLSRQLQVPCSKVYKMALELQQQQ